MVKAFSNGKYSGTVESPSIATLGTGKKRRYSANSCNWSDIYNNSKSLFWTWKEVAVLGEVVINRGAVIVGLTVIWIQSLFYVSAICKYVEYYNVNISKDPLLEYFLSYSAVTLMRWLVLL